MIRLNKYISNSGLCTRREADAYIVDGRVKVDKKIVKTLGYKVSFNAEVRVDNQIIVPYLYSYIVLNKPIDFKLKGENNIYNLLNSSKIDNLIITEKNIDDLKGLVVFSNDIEFNKNFRTFLTKINQLFHVKFKNPISLENLDFLRKNKSKNLKIISVNFVNNTSKNEIGLEIISDNYLNVVGLLKSLKNEIISIDRVLIDNISKKKLSSLMKQAALNEKLSIFKEVKTIQLVRLFGSVILASIVFLISARQNLLLYAMMIGVMILYYRPVKGRIGEDLDLTSEELGSLSSTKENT